MKKIRLISTKHLRSAKISIISSCIKVRKSAEEEVGGVVVGKGFISQLTLDLLLSPTHL